ncbi:hypothetical protein DNHGIG_26130 [Collibacillus ludicampi]|uniref:ATP-binding protein n=2 Tax=Collibacillus ludicampi TaxID=2771369 RepID=A0AAV4LHR9_9BACL|nr:hypothetical protein DNHGIG_26130 [Collibacillus ludicampi]
MRAEPGDEEDKKRIEFYVSMPVDFLDAFKTKFRGHEQWKRCTLEEVPVNEFSFPPDKDTDLYRLKYKRHDMFSLSFNYAAQTSPLRDLMNVSNELKAGESVDLFIRSESMDRGKWKKVADFAWEQWNKGSVPFRAGIDPGRMLRNLFLLMTQFVFEIKSLFQDVMKAFEHTFFHKSGEPVSKRERPKIVNPEREELLVNGDLSERTKKKRNLPTFKTIIRYSVHSSDEIRRGMLARSVAVAFEDLSGDNRLQSVKINLRAKQELDDLRQWKIKDLDPNIMSIDEMGKLQQLPTHDLQLEFKEALESNQRVESEVPKAFLDERGILVGTATDRGNTFNIRIPTVDKDFLFTPRIVCGSPRMGKDQHVINMIVEAKRKHNIGAIIPDVVNERNGHRGMGDAIRDHLPPEDVLDFDLGNTDHPIYLGLESIVRNIPDMRIAADRIAEEIAQFLLSDGDEDKFQTGDYLREASKVVNGDPLGIKLMFMSKTFRQQKIEELDGIFDMDIWKDFDKMSEGKQGQLYAPVMRRLGQIMNSEFLKPIFCQNPNPLMDLYRWIDEGKVIIFRIPTGQISERAVEILLYWIVLNVFLIKVAQGGQSKAVGTFLVLNEPHQFLSPGLVHFMERMLSEGPKYRLAPIVVFHHFSQFKKYPGFVDMMLSASANWHIFKNTNHKVYETLMPYLSRTFDSPQQAFEATKRFQYIACWLNSQGEYESPFIADALPMVGERYPSQDNTHLTKQHTQNYGRPINEILEEIRTKNKLTFQTSA